MRVRSPFTIDDNLATAQKSFRMRVIFAGTWQDLQAHIEKTNSQCHMTEHDRSAMVLNMYKSSLARLFCQGFGVILKAWVKSGSTMVAIYPSCQSCNYQCVLVV